MKPQIKRAIVIVLDSVGIGELPDAAQYGDAGSHTVGHIAAQVTDLALPHLQRLGLGNIAPLAGLPPSDLPTGAYGKMAERSAGKDTTTGHWELLGVALEQPFPVYPHGFPADVIAEFTRRTGKTILGNYPASGTQIIAELGATHVATGQPIVYTSADSVFQIAAHESVIPINALYALCQHARDLLHGEHAVGRVIARPFTGAAGNFTRTARRKDFSLTPPHPTLLDIAKAAGYPVTGVGKIDHIFADQGLTASNHTTNDMAGVDATLEVMRAQVNGLILTNLCDFDMLYGHRNDVIGYARALERFDARLPELLAALRPDDVLLLTADHGCDPTMPGTDHSREYVPLLIAGQGVPAGVNLGIRPSFADLAATIAELLALPAPRCGESFANLIS